MARRLILLALLSISNTATGADFLGFSLGEPFTLKPCGTSDGAPCIYQYGERSGDPIIQLPESEVPDWMDHRMIAATTAGGRLEGVLAGTKGASVQHEVLEALVRKYGKPTVMDKHEVQNLMGAKFQSITAIWSLPNLTITLNGTSSKITSGNVSAYTDRGNALMNELGTRSKSGKRDF